MSPNKFEVQKIYEAATVVNETISQENSIFKTEYSRKMFLMGLKSSQIDEAITALSDKDGALVGIYGDQKEAYLAVLRKMKAEINITQSKVRQALKVMPFVIDALIPQGEVIETTPANASITALSSAATTAFVDSISPGESLVKTAPVTQSSLTPQSIPPATNASTASKIAEKPKVANPIKKTPTKPKGESKIELKVTAVEKEEVKLESPEKEVKQTPLEKSKKYLVSEGFTEIENGKFKNKDQDLTIIIADGKVDFMRSIPRVFGKWDLNQRERAQLLEVAAILNTKN